MEKKILLTEDGSHSIYTERFKESYHSSNGAINESLHVFIQNGLAKIEKQKINILEIGFGTGLNTFLSLLHAQNNNLEICYTAIEKYPVELYLVDNLNYSEQLNSDKNLFLSLHSSEWNKSVAINYNFSLHKIETDLANYSYNPDLKIDIVFFDAFSPKTQEELWTIDVFKRIHSIMNSDAIFCTYSSAGIVKQNLRSSGFKVKRLPGPKGKFHILNAFKI